MTIEDLDDFSEVEQTTAKTIDLVNNDAIDLSGSYVRQQTSKTRAFHIASGKATIVVLGVKALPAFMLLAFDIEFARFTLSVQ